MSPTEKRRASLLTPDRLALSGLLIFTLLVRGGVLWTMRGNLEQDPDAYREIGENLLRHGEFALGKPNGDDGVSKPKPTAYRPPLYPVVLSNLPTADGQRVSLVKVALLHVVLGVCTAWLTWLTARRVGSAHLQDASLGIAHPTIAGLIVACDPILLNQQTLVMTETLATFLAILSLWCLARFDDSRSWFNAALAGGAIGLAVLCRPTFLPWLVFVGIGVLILRGRSAECGARSAEWRQGRGAWISDFAWQAANVAGLIVAAGAVMSPWAIRNYRVFGKPILTTTHGGYTLYLGNNKDFYEYLAKGDFGLPWEASSLKGVVFAKDEPMTEFKHQILVVLNEEGKRFQQDKARHHYTDNPELFGDRAGYALAKWWMRDHPRECFWACMYRLGQLWSPLPHKLTADESTGRRLLRYATCAWYCGVYALAAIGVWRLRWRLFRPPWLWGVLLCLAFMGVHTFYWTNLRMRAPLMPFVALVAAAAVGTDSSRRILR